MGSIYQYLQAECPIISSASRFLGGGGVCDWLLNDCRYSNTKFEGLLSERSEI